MYRSAFGGPELSLEPLRQCFTIELSTPPINFSTSRISYFRLIKICDKLGYKKQKTNLYISYLIIKRIFKIRKTNKREINLYFCITFYSVYFHLSSFNFLNYSFFFVKKISKSDFLVIRFFFFTRMDIS